MENASKALIIAGAILLAILIISLGLIIYQKAAGTINGVSLSEQEVATFNGKFTAYEGGNVSGTQVKALIQAVNASNTSATRDNTGLEITLKYAASATATAAEITGGKTSYVTSGINTGATYKVVSATSKNSGAINEITITKN